VIGSDESGPSSSSSSVIVAASVCVLPLSQQRNRNNYRPIFGVDDSKRLTKEQRRQVFDEIVANSPDTYVWNVTTVVTNADDDEATTITSTDAETTRTATILEVKLDALKHTIESVVETLFWLHRRRNTIGGIATSSTTANRNASRSLQPPNIYSIVDGHKAPRIRYDYDGIIGRQRQQSEAQTQQQKEKYRTIPCRPYKRGDATVYTVALASIVARVVRDDYDYAEHVVATARAAAANKSSGIARMASIASAATKDDVEEEVSSTSSPKATTTASSILQQQPVGNFHGTPPRRRRRTVDSYERRKIVISTTKSVSSVLGALALMTYLPSAQLSSSSSSSSSYRSSYVASATTTDPRTGISLPDVGEIEAAVPKDWRAVDNPFTSDDPKSLFGRLDSSDDGKFYDDPRFVEHVDEQAIQRMTQYISKVAIPPETNGQFALLDLCSSWTSHIDVDDGRRRIGRVAGLGMNARELQSNPVLTEWVVRDLNTDPILPYEDNSFDCVLCQLSIDYLTRPLEVCKEVSRVLKPGGKVHVLFSNRLFLSKAVAVWTGADDIDHAFLVASYLHFCDGGFDDIRARDLSAREGGRQKRIVGDPLYVVTATARY